MPSEAAAKYKALGVDVTRPSSAAADNKSLSRDEAAVAAREAEATALAAAQEVSISAHNVTSGDIYSDWLI